MQWEFWVRLRAIRCSVVKRLVSGYQEKVHLLRGARERSGSVFGRDIQSSTMCPFMSLPAHIAAMMIQRRFRKCIIIAWKLDNGRPRSSCKR
ncbi:hypothetical protein M413DRAFT_247017 [Hebeloma cylindrosporum]|uniref:Uncharacterized protein n=1 Tax=Hebeloma cylindrosporum TaxID=76867 RepID=A0A0C3C3K5_HEBCY|nr:hypothetical protein M413DRAFT_247017 [Hebeloma cylindrosporum h7]